MLTRLFPSFLLQKPLLSSAFLPLRLYSSTFFLKIKKYTFLLSSEGFPGSSCEERSVQKKPGLYKSYYTIIIIQVKRDREGNVCSRGKLMLTGAGLT